MLFSRSDNSLLAHWWWTVDRWLIAAVLVLATTGILMTFAAGTAVAERLGLDSFHFAIRQGFFLVIGLAVMFSVSLMSQRGIRRLALVLFPVLLVAVVLTLYAGPEIKGATRWISLGSFTIQPTEFLKPVVSVLSGWMLAEEFKQPAFPGRKIALIIFGLTAFLMVLQPDFGQTALLSAVIMGQLILAGLPFLWLGILGAAGLAGAVVAYFSVPHVQARIDAFLNPGSSDTYQIDTALNAFMAGGLFGRGPGEGTVKKVLPDAHTDFIFAVAGEEFGILICIGVLALFAVIVIRILLPCWLLPAF